MTEIQILEQILSCVNCIAILSYITMSMSVFGIGMYLIERLRKMKESRLNK